MDTAHVIQQPAGEARQLFLLFHGVRATADEMVPLGRRLAQAFPQACVVAFDAPHPCTSGPGFEWYPVPGITPEAWRAHLSDTVPQFVGWVRHWQARTGVPPAATALAGFSQGAVMSLESMQREPSLLAARVVALGGRYCDLPEAVSREVSYHFIHGDRDKVVNLAIAQEAARHVGSVGGDVTLDVVPNVGHRVSDAMADMAVYRLQTHVPRRLWEEALGAVPQRPAGS